MSLPHDRAIAEFRWLAMATRKRYLSK
jgi:hypothetical protein